MLDELKLGWELWGIYREFKGGNMSEETILQLAALLIPIIAPMITAGVKKLAPKIPKLLVVILQPILGAVLGGLTGVGVDLGAGLGIAGIGVREVVDQSKKALTG